MFQIGITPCAGPGIRSTLNQPGRVRKETSDIGIEIGAAQTTTRTVPIMPLSS